MTFKSILRAASASALVASLALGMVPASAQDDDYGDGKRQRGALRDQVAPSVEARAQRQQERLERQAARAEAQASRREAPGAEVAQAPIQRDWDRSERRAERAVERAGGDWNRRDNSNNDWGQARAARAQAEAEARARARAQAQAQANTGVYTGGGWDGRRSGDGTWERNRSYGDRDRNTTYRDGYRDGRRADNWRDQRRTDNAYRSGYRDGYRTDHYRDGRAWDGHRSWSRDWRRDNRYNWYHYRNSNRHLYSLGRYYSPYRNHRYSRLSIGFHLGSSFFGSRYWINDPWQYRLPAAYGPYRWVRYYDDALLVDIYSGRVVDVIYDFFW